MCTIQYQGILFPDRAESLAEPSFSGYKVFLDHWDELGNRLRDLYEGLAIRRDSRVLAIHGAQGSGKTLFARKLASDIERTRVAIGKGTFEPDSSNLWHRISGTADLVATLIMNATAHVSVKEVENTKEWVAEAAGWLNPLENRHCILIADNAERAYFRQGLLNLSDAEYLQMGETEEAMKMVAQNMVAHFRSDLRGLLLVILSNDDDFLLTFLDAVDRQHEGLASLSCLPLPHGADKETVIRVNTNRLNPISYWFCLDKAGPPDKRAIRSALLSPSTYPTAFAAVDGAIRSASPSRVGRPAKKNLLSLVVLSGDDQPPRIVLDPLGLPSREDFAEGWAAARVYSKDWVVGALQNQRERQLLESEWDLRIVVLGPPFVSALLSGDDRVDLCIDVISRLEQVLGPGTHSTTREAWRQEIEAFLRNWPATGDVNLATFWNKGQARSNDYEEVLRAFLTGYDRGGVGFLGYRPDYCVSKFKPCAVTAAISDEINAINVAIKRDAHMFEFTAQRTPSAESIRSYLNGKLVNYLNITQEQ